jgi:phosphoglycerol transferase MdoB-like AlkP superfamily enzyme
MLNRLFANTQRRSAAASPWLAVARALLVPILLTMLCLWASRWALALWQADRVSAAQGWAPLLWQGMRFDFVLLGMVWALPAALSALFASSRRAWPYWAQFLRAYGLVWFVFIVFMEMATPSFVAQYDARPNYMFVEYLGYVQEVGQTLLKDYWGQILAALLALPLLGLGFWRATHARTLTRGLKIWQALPLAVLLFAAFALAGRGSFDHRPANPASTAFSTDHFANELPLSSAYTLLYALRLNSKVGDGGIAYGQMPRERMIELVRQSTGERLEDFTRNDIPMWHGHPKVQIEATKPRNIVIILEESLGAEFVGSLGGTPVTPNLDALAKEGIWLSNLYATGTRSVRGIEAVVAGYPPTSAVSTVRLPKSQKNFATLPNILKQQGYHSTFFYGGEGHFDNMQAFFLGNGFDRVIDRKDFPPNTFWGTWGASDEDLFNLAHKTLEAEHGKRSTFSLIFTSTNHTPFEFPDGRIELHEQPKNTVNNAVKFTDYALGEFIKKAKQSKYWDDTVFLVVADHNSRVYGPSLIPIERFHIPGLFLGGFIQKPQVIETLASQIDLAPTLLTMAGLPDAEPWIGRDLTQARNLKGPGHAIMQFDKIQAYMEGQDVVVLQPDTPPRSMRYTSKKLEDSPSPKPELVERAIAHALYAKLAYQEQWHRAP